MANSKKRAYDDTLKTFFMNVRKTQDLISDTIKKYLDGSKSRLPSPEAELTVSDASNKKKTENDDDNLVAKVHLTEGLTAFSGEKFS